MIWKDFWELPDRIFESDGPSWMSQFLSKLSSWKGCSWGIIILENAKMVEFRKMIIIVLDIKLAHLSTHFLSFKFWQNLEIFVILEGFWKNFGIFQRGTNLLKSGTPKNKMTKSQPRWIKYLFLSCSVFKLARWKNHFRNNVSYLCRSHFSAFGFIFSSKLNKIGHKYSHF